MEKEVLNYPIAYAPMPIVNNSDKTIGYIPNLCYVVGFKRKYKSDGSYNSQYDVVFIVKIIDVEAEKVEMIIPKYDNDYECCSNFETVSEISLDYSNMEKMCRRQSLVMYRTKHFNIDDSMKYFDCLEDCKNMLNELHSKSSTYKTLCLNVGNAKL